MTRVVGSNGVFIYRETLLNRHLIYLGVESVHPIIFTFE